MASLLLLTSTIFLVKNALCSNILIICPVASPSHQIWNYAFAEGLMAKGHNVTMAGPDTHMHKKSKNYHPIVFKDVAANVIASGAIDIEDTPNQSIFEQLFAFYGYKYESCKYLLLTEGFQEILKLSKNAKFDLIIMDVTIGPCLYPLIQKFNYPPAIGITAFLLPPYLSNTFGNYLPTSYLPHYLLNYPQEMTFQQRLKNFVISNFDLFYTEVFEKHHIQQLAKETFGNHMARFEDLEKHISLLLCNLNPAFHYPQPIPPNIVPVGGLHARPPRKLPQDLQDIMDKSSNGVILMSLGTNVRADMLEKSKINAILRAFSQLKQTVIWKFESNFENIPPNVIIRKFLPQNDMLGHPNTKLFITHGGGLSTLETAYHGVPIIGIPFIADQYMLTSAMVNRKLGLKLDFPQLTTEKLLTTINEALNNKEYSNNIKQISKRMRDTISTPLETAVFWAEYAIRHNGTHFLNPKSRYLPLFVSTSADVVIFLVVLFLVITYALYFVLRLLYKQLTDTKKKEKLN